MRLILVILISICSLNISAQDHDFVVTDIVSDVKIQIQRTNKNISISPDDLLVVYSHDSHQVLGYVKVDWITDSSDLFIASIATHDKSGLIRPENYLKKIELTKIGNDIPARFDLVRKEDHKIAAKYKPLVYLGAVSGFSASQLNQKEFLAGPSIVGYGITNKFQVSTNLVSSMFNVYNISIKNRIYSNDDLEFSIENGFQFFPKTLKGSYQFTGQLDMSSNSNFKSYSKLRIFTKKPEDQSLYNNEEYNRDINVELQLSYGYMLSNWNQVIFGPKVDVNKKRVGGILSYYIVDKNFHTMFGVSSNDFSEFRLGKQAYLINLDFWWRF